MVSSFKMLSEKPRRMVILFLSIIAISGIALFISYLRQPSEIENRFVFGLSLARLVFGILFLALLVVNIGIILFGVIRLWPWQERIEANLDAFLSKKIILVLATLYVILILSGTLFLLIIPPIALSLSFLEPVRIRLSELVAWLFLASFLLVTLFRILYSEAIYKTDVVSRLDLFLMAVGVFVFTFFIYEHVAAWINWIGKVRYAYWNLLAEQFLHGELYLRHPPTTHDLTLYGGKWYVAAPPLPAIMMMPLAYLIGGENIITGDFSMFFSAINGVLLFLICDQLIKRGWIKLPRAGTLWVVALVIFGTPHLWVGISGRMWFVSQVLTVTWLAFATLAVFKSWSPWIVGASLGLAIGARPNSLMTWPFVFAIAMQIIKENQGHVNFKEMLAWAFKSAVPIGLAVAGLLFYNYARFKDFLDFGYTTINGDLTVAQNAQTYGLFSPHFIVENLKAMFLSLPTIRWGRQWPILPSSVGMNVFLVTPPLIYLFHRYEPKWWIIGAWTAIVFNFIMLVLYHNTGAHQFGYRYILDMIIPLMAMLAVALNRKVPWHFVALLMLSIVFNIYGANWFMNG